MARRRWWRFGRDEDRAPLDRLMAARMRQIAETTRRQAIALMEVSDELRELTEVVHMDGNDGDT